jgi:hypothetical protein
MTVFFNVCRFFSAGMFTLLRLILRTMIRPFGGINEEAIHPLQRRLQLLWRRSLAIRHQLEMHQGVIQNRRELMQVFVGSRPRPRKLRAQDITGGIRFIIDIIGFNQG